MPEKARVAGDGQWLEWRYPTDEAKAATAGGYGRGRLSDLWVAFMRLGDGPKAGDLERFARAWGVLHAEGRPGRGSSGKEKVAAWGRTIAFFGALDRIAATGRLDPADLNTVRGWLGNSPTLSGFVANIASRSKGFPPLELVRAVLDEFTMPPNVRVRVVRDRRAPGGLATRLHPTRLLGGLAIALLERTQGAAGARTQPCSGCSRPIVPERPHPTRRAWCSRCRGRKQARIIEGESRARRRARRT